MYRALPLVLPFLMTLSAGTHAVPLDTELSQAERDEVSERLRRFYDETSPDVMSARVPKFDARTGVATEPNPELRHPGAPSSALSKLAGAKATDPFQAERCRSFLAKAFPNLRCELADATVEPNDRVENLTESWVSSDRIPRTLDRIPVSGEVRKTVWSGDYWRTRWGLTSYRSHARTIFENYGAAISAYAQPADWIELLRGATQEKLAQVTTRWSPAEKYDLTVGDELFTLTNQQKQEGRGVAGPGGEIPSWYGICHGWAAAASLVPSPLAPVTAVGARNVRVTWYPDDLRAMAALAWASGSYRNNLVGGRCNAKKAETYPNGRLKQQECFDTSPATFHMALGSMLGLEGQPFIADSTFDQEVWNQPIISYATQYFNPLHPAVRSAKWTDVAVPYDNTLKRRDRFQKPLTRGRRTTNGYDDSDVAQIVGAATTIVFLGGNAAVHGPTPAPNVTVRATYTYDLELTRTATGLAVTGGEWHENSHPDFLWVPRRDAVASRENDRYTLDVRLSRSPTEWITRVARATSTGAYPLCRVLKQLVDASSGTTGYGCRYGIE